MTKLGVSTRDWRSGAARAVGFLGLWLVISGGHLADLAVGAVAAGAASWASLRLLPPGAWQGSPAALLQLLLRFVSQSVVAGLDVARRALDPDLPLRPGFVSYKARLASGPPRNAFCALTGLMPGTLPAGSDRSGAVIVHCLDVDQPVMDELSVDEGMLTRVLGTGRND
jgi:multicomponent Na+:H+ antiporter subunit E